MPPNRSPAEFWSHFQEKRTDVFAAGKGRLDYLIRLANKLTKGRRLLNIGCGNGYLEQRARQNNWTVVSVDPDEKSVARLQALGVDARCGMIESLPLEAHSVDVVTCTEIFEHLTPESLNAGLDEIRRVLKPGGLLIGTVPYRENLALSEVFCPDCRKTFHRWGHEQSFDEVSMQTLLGNYFSVRKVKPVYLPTWEVAHWTGKLSMFARLGFSWIGVHGANSNLLFVAARISQIK